MDFAKRVFFWAGFWGLVVIIPGFFNEPWIAQHQPPPLNHPEFYYGFYAVAFTFQVLFLQISRDPVRHRDIMPICMLEKLGFFISSSILYGMGRTSNLIAFFAALDLMWAVLFYIAYRKTANASPAL
jgi:hypothetical protein